MPVLSIFYGIVVTIYWFYHAPPHVHARYAEHEVQIDIQQVAPFIFRFGTDQPQEVDQDARNPLAS